jgi:hypothetical protein
LSDVIEFAMADLGMGATFGEGAYQQPDTSDFLAGRKKIGTNCHLIDPVSKAITAIADVWNLFGMYQGSAWRF